jgi:hypothetical protein
MVELSGTGRTEGSSRVVFNLFCAEILMRIRRIHPDAGYHGSGLFKLRQIALEVASLTGKERNRRADLTGN